MLIRQEVLADAVSKIVTVCERPTKTGTAVQHFFYIKFQGTGSELKLSAGNMMRKVEILIKEVSSHEPFCLGVMGQQFHALLSVLPPSNMVLEYNGTVLLLSTGASSHYQLPVLQRDCFPTEPVPVDKWEPFEVNKFLAVLASLSFCSNVGDEARAFARAVSITDSLIICTDGYRLCYVDNHILKPKEPAMYPIESISCFANLFKGIKDGFVHLGDNSIHFSAEGRYAATSLLSGKPPNYKSALPKGANTTCVISRADLYEALKRVRVCAKSAPAEFTFIDNTCTVKVDSDNFKGQETVPCVYSGSATRMSLNSKYMHEAIKYLDGDKALLELRGSQMPLVVKDDKEVMFNVIVPFRERDV